MTEQRQRDLQGRMEACRQIMAKRRAQEEVLEEHKQEVFRRQAELLQQKNDQQQQTSSTSVGQQQPGEFHKLTAHQREAAGRYFGRYAQEKKENESFDEFVERVGSICEAASSVTDSLQPAARSTSDWLQPAAASTSEQAQPVSRHSQ